MAPAFIISSTSPKPKLTARVGIPKAAAPSTSNIVSPTSTIELLSVIPWFLSSLSKSCTSTSSLVSTFPSMDAPDISSKSSSTPRFLRILIEVVSGLEVANATRYPSSLSFIRHSFTFGYRQHSRNPFTLYLLLNTSTASLACSSLKPYLFPKV